MGTRMFKEGKTSPGMSLFRVGDNNINKRGTGKKEWRPKIEEMGKTKKKMGGFAHRESDE